MSESIDASLSEPVHPLIERALTSKIPIAELIGFGVEEVGGQTDAAIGRRESARAYQRGPLDYIESGRTDDHEYSRHPLGKD